MVDFEDNSNDRTDEPLNMTSMVDVVFILLAFFVLSTRFIDAEHDLAMSHTEQAVNQRGASSEDLPPQVTIRLWPGETNRMRVSIGQIELVGDQGDDAAVFAGITAKLEEINLPEVKVVIASHPDLAMSEVAKAVDAVMASPMRQLSLSRLGGDGETGVATPTER